MTYRETIHGFEIATAIGTVTDQSHGLFHDTLDLKFKFAASTLGVERGANLAHFRVVGKVSSRLGRLDLICFQIFGYQRSTMKLS
jgi:hypothetical protein